MNNDSLQPEAGSDPDLALNPVSTPTPAPAPTSSTQLAAPNQETVAAQSVISSQPQPQVSQPFPVSPSSGSDDKSKKNKKRNLIIGCVIGGIAAIVVIVVLVVLLLKNGEITVSCTENKSRYGTTYTSIYNIRVKDGEIISGDVSYSMDLSSLSSLYASHEKEIVDSATEFVKENCEEEHCAYNYDYKEGESLKYNVQYKDSEGVKNGMVHFYNIENLSAQEIADELKDTLTDEDTVCEQH